MKKRSAVLLAAVAAVALLAVLILHRPGETVYVLKRTDVDYKILASCTVSFPAPYDLAAKSQGDVLRVPVAEGQWAKRGDLLVQLDDFKERQHLAIALNNYENAKLKLVNAKEEAYPRLKEQLNDAGAALEEARKNADRLGALFNAGAVARVDYENARTRLDAAQARYNQTKLQIDAYSRSGAAAELINQLNVLSAQVELARRAVDEKRLVAPYDCQVVHLDAKEGETVASGRTAVTILEKEPWVLETNVDQKELSFLADGLPCLVVFDAYPAEKVRARISLVCSTIDYAKGTCNVKLQVEEDRPFIKFGMTGSVEISGRSTPGVNAGVLALPVEYVLRQAEGNFVLLRAAGRIEKRAVECTPIGEKWVSVRNLPEGSRVVLPK
jgi:HlyD family secretion protein